eukprot:scaffold71997_cov18-Tisochrysis_lutea.AAC.1
MDHAGCMHARVIEGCNEMPSDAALHSLSALCPGLSHSMGFVPCTYATGGGYTCTANTHIKYSTALSSSSSPCGKRQHGAL